MRQIDRVTEAYDSNNDTGPNAPVHWTVYNLANACGRQQEQIGHLQNQVTKLEILIVDLEDRLAALETERDLAESVTLYATN